MLKAGALTSRKERTKKGVRRELKMPTVKQLKFPIKLSILESTPFPQPLKEVP